MIPLRPWRQLRRVVLKQRHLHVEYGSWNATMQRSDGPEVKRSSALPLLLAFMVASAVIALLSFLTLGFAGAILALALALSAFICFQYLLWGWWLGPLIQQGEAKRERLRNSESEPPQR